ncbi:hypothetical protein BDA96_07G116700 [Sorghum bicolor]|uniref:Uncharacterized protein n=2 Tax=Sorghum bicolor TaxID=4558 RepID=A0A921U9F5_SORBI|nr:hypothetical protein BDA96_07G116700 [Sorghum bicolor]OQU80320.1 hypothetical protein SORBI_3007G110366 [Sorghum bicolor]
MSGASMNSGSNTNKIVNILMFHRLHGYIAPCIIIIIIIREDHKAVQSTLIDHRHHHRHPLVHRAILVSWIRYRQLVLKGRSSNRLTPMFKLVKTIAETQMQQLAERLLPCP